MKKLFNYNAKVTNVVDGDTVDATVDLGFNVSTNVRIRLAGINAPEMKSSDKLEREMAELSKKFLSEKILGKDILLDSTGKDKYGRWVGILYINNVPVNNMLISEGYAQPHKY